MGQTFVEKALARAAGLDRATAGQIVDARPHVALSHDNSAAIASTFANLGAGRVRHPDRLVITLDHAVPAPTSQHAANHARIRRFVAEQGIAHFYDAGRGICHQVASEEALVRPGQVILGADSHTTHFGWLGAFGAGIGRSEMAALWATGELWLRVPETVYVELEGALPLGVTAKDLSLWVLRHIGPAAGIYCAIEFGGSGLATLDPAARMVLANMMAESGAKSAYLPPDDAVFGWLAVHEAARTGRRPGECEAEHRASALYPDPDAAYAARYHIDLAGLEPAVACPHRPDNVVPLSQVAGTRVDQAFLGTCTNGRLEDLAAAAAVLRGPDGQIRQVAPGTRFVVIPASRRVLQDAIAAGYVETFLAAGAMIGTPGCGPCMGNHLGIPAPGEVTISSANRNFRGRMGTPESEVYLAGPAVVAASAVAGRIADPREVGGAVAGVPPQPNLSRSAVPHVSASSVIASGSADQASLQRPPAKQSPSASIHRPSAIRQIAGRAWKYGDDVNTDVIFPGKYTYTVTDPAEMACHALEDLDPTFASAVQPGDIVVGGRNWGCGSSREQAVLCLKAAGVRAIVAGSFGRIYFRNAVNNGLLPVTCPDAVAAIQDGETVTVDLEAGVVRCAAGDFPFPPLSPSLAEIIEAGGLVPRLQKLLANAGSGTARGEEA